MYVYQADNQSGGRQAPEDRPPGTSAGGTRLALALITPAVTSDPCYAGDLASSAKRRGCAESCTSRRRLLAQPTRGRVHFRRPGDTRPPQMFVLCRFPQSQWGRWSHTMLTVLCLQKITSHLRDTPHTCRGAHYAQRMPQIANRSHSVCRTVPAITCVCGANFRLLVKSRASPMTCLTLTLVESCSRQHIWCSIDLWGCHMQLNSLRYSADYPSRG